MSVDGVLGHESKDAVGAAVKESIAGLPDSAPFKTYLTGDLDKHVDLVLRYGCLLCSIRLCQGCCWIVWRTPARKIQVRQVTNVTLTAIFSLFIPIRHAPAGGASATESNITFPVCVLLLLDRVPLTIGMHACAQHAGAVIQKSCMCVRV